MLTSSTAQTTATVPREVALAIYEKMLLTQLFEQRLDLMYRNGDILGGMLLGTGNEAVSVAATSTLGEGDVIAPTHRGMGAHFVRGETARGMLLQILGRAEGGTRGRDNTQHQGSMKTGVIGMISHLGATPTTAAGCALAFKIRRQPNVAIGFTGDGATSLGDFHETMNTAAVLKLPFVMIIENNQWAYSTPIQKQYRCEKLSDRAIGYGIPGCTIDGTDAELVYATVKEAVDRARAGEGPTLIETVTMRLRGHSAADGAEYVPKDVLQRWQGRHPVDLYRGKLMERGWLSEADDAARQGAIKLEIEQAVEYAKAAPYPEPHTLFEGLYAD